MIPLGLQPAARDENHTATSRLSVKRNFQPRPPGVVVISSALRAALSVHNRPKLQQRLKARNQPREILKNRLGS